jgi:hypothetical protein
MPEVHSLTGLRDAGEHPFVCYVVTEAGRIKTIRYHRGVSTPVLRFRESKDNAGQIVLTGPYLSDAAVALGWAFLDDLYRQQGFEKGWQVWLEYQDAARKGREVGEFPSQWLPREVVQRVELHPEMNKWHAPELPAEELPMSFELEKQSDAKPRAAKA